MNKFIIHTGIAAPIYRSNIDTDQIIPKQFLTRIERTGYGAFLFNDWRFGEDGAIDSDFELNDPRYKGASILITGPNFGCGSSREHAAWSLMDYGFRAVIAPSFGDIFYTNSLKNGLLPVKVDDHIVSQLVWQARNGSGLSITIDLVALKLSSAGRDVCNFHLDDFRRHCLLNGLDEIGLTLEHEDHIAAYEHLHANHLAAA